MPLTLLYGTSLEETKRIRIHHLGPFLIQEAFFDEQESGHVWHPEFFEWPTSDSELPQDHTMCGPTIRPQPPPPDCEGYISWRTAMFPEVDVQTYYRMNGSLSNAQESKNGQEPVIILHGGPGGCHNYMLRCVELFDSGRTIILYE